VTSQCSAKQHVQNNQIKYAILMLQRYWQQRFQNSLFYTQKI
jgi:hypothetical protein